MRHPIPPRPISPYSRYHGRPGQQAQGVRLGSDTIQARQAAAVTSAYEQRRGSRDVLRPTIVAGSCYFDIYLLDDQNPDTETKISREDLPVSFGISNDFVSPWLKELVFIPSPQEALYMNYNRPQRYAEINCFFMPGLVWEVNDLGSTVSDMQIHLAMAPFYTPFDGGITYNNKPTYDAEDEIERYVRLDADGKCDISYEAEYAWNEPEDVTESGDARIVLAPGNCYIDERTSTDNVGWILSAKNSQRESDDYLEVSIQLVDYIWSNSLSRMGWSW